MWYLTYEKHMRIDEIADAFKVGMSLVMVALQRERERRAEAVNALFTAVGERQEPRKPWWDRRGRL